MADDVVIAEVGSWYLFEKHFRGGMGRYAMKITPEIKQWFETEETLMEYIGENTDGGSNYGYTIYPKLYKRKPPNKDPKKPPYRVLEYKPVTTMGLAIKK